MGVSGTREWSTHSANCVTGCAHDCRYCYAKAREVYRFKRVRPGDWPRPRVRASAFARRCRRVEGTVMFPTTHDITPEVLPDCLRFLRGLLEPGNRVLIVSKPHVDCIAAICEQLEAHRSQVLFRFTIGSDDDGILGYWEPGAPTFPERLASLQHAHGLGWETSVSIEPMLDAPNIVRLVDALEPFVTDSIWIGKMNDIGRRVAVETDADRRQVRRIERNQLDGAIRTVYESLRDRPVVKWKESIKDVVGIDRPQVAGLDI